MKQTISPLGTLLLALTRIAIGWHLLYEGIVKIMNPNWSAAGFLKKSSGPLAGFFNSLASDQYIGYVNFANKWGLAVIGGALMLGLLTRVAAFFGAVLVASYYCAYLPVPGTNVSPGDGGHYLIVNRNAIEAIALLMLCVFPGNVLGLDNLIFGRSVPNAAPTPKPQAQPMADLVIDDAPASRRSVLASLAGVPFAGAFAYTCYTHINPNSFEERALIDGYSGASAKDDRLKELLTAGPATGPSTQPQIQVTELAKKIKGTMPQASIKGLSLSRMILGGNLIGGWAHARDLIYASKLVKAYHTREKVFQTFQIAEACGVNAILTNPALCPIISDYWKTTGGKIKFISDCGDRNNLAGAFKRSIDNGASACYVQGGVADEIIEKDGEKGLEVIAKALEMTRQAGLPAGIGAHKLKTIQVCVEKGLIPDFWMKTLHVHKYWSARPGEPQHDNIWCEEPTETIAFMKARKEPWIAFKILAAGALQPQVGFEYAFKGGADFICVGMYDFQIVDDVNMALAVLNNKKLIDARERAWQAV